MRYDQETRWLAPEEVEHIVRASRVRAERKRLAEERVDNARRERRALLLVVGKGVLIAALVWLLVVLLVAWIP